MRRPRWLVTGVAVVIALLAGVLIGQVLSPGLPDWGGRRAGSLSIPSPTAARPSPAAAPTATASAASPSPAPSAPAEATSARRGAAPAPQQRIPNLAYDSTHGQVLLFGGYGGGATSLDDTWVWDGAWIEKHPQHRPPGRFRASLVDDPAGGGVLLFGGSSASGLYDDTWTWDGSDWKVRLGPGPSPREGGAVAYDALRKKVVLFGGQNRTPPYRLADTWTWDGTGWTQIEPAASPSPRFLSWTTFDAARGYVLLMGGFDNINDTWTWDGRTWTQLHPGRTPPDLGEATPWIHALTYDPVRKVALLAYLNGSAIQTYVWDGAAWRQLQSPHTPPPCSAGLVFDVRLGVALEFGCLTNGSTEAGVAWTWDGTDWKEAP